MTSKKWDGLGLGPTDEELLEEARRAVPDSGLVVVSCPVGAVADAAGRRLAKTWVQPAAHAEDLHLAKPDGGGWTIAELAEQVRRPANYVPTAGRCVIVICAADRMDRRAADFLLTTVESPAPQVLFVFCCTDEQALAVTLRSRAVRTIRLGPPDPHRVGLRLRRAGVVVHPHAAALAARLAELTEALLDPARTEKACEFLREACAGLDRSKPYTTASRLAQNLAGLAWAITGRPQGDRSTRTLLRQLTQAWIMSDTADVSYIGAVVQSSAARDACALIQSGVSPGVALAEYCLAISGHQTGSPVAADHR